MYSHRKLPDANLRYTVSKTLLKFGVQRTINKFKCKMCKCDLCYGQTSLNDAVGRKDTSCGKHA